jgi:predicted chitinase
LSTGGLTNAYAQKAILQTSYKESQINSESNESTASDYLATLNKRGLNYIYQTFPQLKPNSRVSTKEGYKDTGVPESVIREKMQAGNDIWYDYVYGGIMGNDQKGDGWKYRGRGFVAITGKKGYQDLQKTFKQKLNIDVDLVNNPDLLTHPDIASKAALIYYANTLGNGNFDKGLKILNDVKTPDEALKLVIRATAGMGNGTHKGVFDEKEFLTGKTEGGVVNRGEGSKAEGSHLYVNYQRALAANKTAEDIMNLSRDNADMKKSLSQGSGAQQVAINNTTNVSSTETTVMPNTNKGSENPQYKRQ